MTLSDGNPLTEAVYESTGSCEWILERKEALGTLNQWPNSTSPYVFQSGNDERLSNERTDKGKKAAWKDLADHLLQTRGLEIEARWLIERLPRKTELWPELHDDTSSIDMSSTKESGCMTESEATAAA